MASYESVIGILEAELTAVADVFGALTPDQWQRSTLLVPVDPDLPKWTVFELAGGTYREVACVAGFYAKLLFVDPDHLGRSEHRSLRNLVFQVQE